MAGVRVEGLNDDFFTWAKADSLGNFQWINAEGYGSYMGATSISLTSDSGYILCGQGYNGGTHYPMIIKINSNGSTIWHKTLEGNWDPDALSIIECYDRGLLFCGHTPGGIYGNDILLAKLNSIGSLLWSKYFNGIYSDEGGYSIIQDKDSGFVMCGFFYDGFTQFSALLMKVDSIGNFLWSKNYLGSNLMYATDLNKTFDNGFILSGSDLYSWPYDHSFIIKTDSIGDTLWTRQFQTTDPINIRSIEQTQDSGYLLSGSLGPQYTEVPILVKLNSNGNIVWSKTYNNSEGVHSGIGAYETNDGGYIIGGDSKFYLIKTDSIGNSCGSYDPAIQLFPINQITINSPVFFDSLNVLTDVSNFIGSATCDTFNIDGCLSLFKQERDNNRLTISVYPNPSDDFINIEYDNEIFTAEIFDSMGQKIISKKIDSKKFQLDVAYCQSGVYLIRCLTNSGYSSQLFLKR